MLATFIPLILMFVVFYFILIRPQKKREKEVQKMRENIEIADEVVTIGGIIGRIVSIKDDTVVIETAGDLSLIHIFYHDSSSFVRGENFSQTGCVGEIRVPSPIL